MALDGGVVVCVCGQDTTAMPLSGVSPLSVVECRVWMRHRMVECGVGSGCRRMCSHGDSVPMHTGMMWWWSLWPGDSCHVM
jgi:hypothetical protein